MKRILITTGDLDGIGLEVTCKAISKVLNSKSKKILVNGLSDFQIIVLASFYSEKKYLKNLNSKLGFLVFENVDLAIRSGHKRCLVLSTGSPAEWVYTAASICFKDKKNSALVTAPLSKQTIVARYPWALGHTEILSRVSKTKSLNMGFVGEHFSVVLATGHIPLNKVSGKLSKKVVVTAVTQALFLKSLLPKAKSMSPLGVLGLNPHSGDNGLIGKEDALIQNWLKPFKKVAVGPLVPDVAFTPNNWKKYSVYVANYHDQGLIPFKTVHGFNSGVHLTLGLPFFRSSVDHGTAKDIFGKNKANSGSMEDAIGFALQFLRSSHV